MRVLLGLVLIAFGLAACIRWREFGEILAHRLIAYDTVWFYQYLYLLIGLFMAALGVAQLLGWLR